MLNLKNTNLTNFEKKILNLRYFHSMTLKAIAIYLGRKKSRLEQIRRIEIKALRKMRSPSCLRNNDLMFFSGR